MLVKNFFGELKILNAEGEGVAVISTMNALDRDGDETLPGAFGEQVAGSFS